MLWEGEWLGKLLPFDVQGETLGLRKDVTFWKGNGEKEVSTTCYRIEN